VPETLLVTTLVMTEGSTVYTYVGPLLAETPYADERTLSLILVVFGIAGNIGNIGNIGSGCWPTAGNPSVRLRQACRSSPCSSR
jgi:hypothetical protein